MQPVVQKGSNIPLPERTVLPINPVTLNVSTRALQFNKSRATKNTS